MTTESITQPSEESPAIEEQAEPTEAAKSAKKNSAVKCDWQEKKWSGLPHWECGTCKATTFDERLADPKNCKKKP